MMQHSATCLLAQKFQITIINELSLTTTCNVFCEPEVPGSSAVPFYQLL